MFMSLPAKIRSRFQNDPGAFLDFVQNPENRDEMIELGLAKAQPRAPVEPEAEPSPSEVPEDPQEPE
jgi:hypothetical protein